ncbi:hypothetical protein [Mycobacteroides abscessus]|uniref:hypothetical protein n=1 Tax=Mycobacteroides abscessus TaxID=36809 RepID=UPI0007F94F0B|nr:hypothetical protein [Mycobacteroides abscessus]ANN98181.1 hypothetical protein BAB74_05060 [Mycobacteroides abscessus]
MTEETSWDGYVVVECAGGSLAEGYWYDGAVHDAPRLSTTVAYTLDAVFACHNPVAVKLNTMFWPNRPPAPWRIRKRDGEWRIEKRQTHGYETWCRFDEGPEAFGAFAAGGAR